MYNVTTIVGGYIGDGGPATNAFLRNPQGVAISSTGECYISDTNNNRIRKVSTNGIITTIAGTDDLGYNGDGGLATNALLYSPFGIAINSIGEVYFADANNNRIRKISSNGIITTIAGTGAYSGFGGDGGLAINAILQPRGIAISSTDELYIADYGNSRIRKIFTNGTITTIAGNGTVGFNGDGGLAINAQLNGPQGITISSIGEIYIVSVLVKFVK